MCVVESLALWYRNTQESQENVAKCIKTVVLMLHPFIGYIGLIVSSHYGKYCIGALLIVVFFTIEKPDSVFM